MKLTSYGIFGDRDAVWYVPSEVWDIRRTGDAVQYVADTYQLTEYVGAKMWYVLADVVGSMRDVSRSRILKVYMLMVILLHHSYLLFHFFAIRSE